MNAPLVAKPSPFLSSDVQVVSRNTVPNSSGVGQTALMRDVENSMPLSSSPCCDETPLIGEVGDMQHSCCLNHCGIRFGVLLRNREWRNETIKIFHFLSHGIHLFALKPFAAACSRHSRSHVVVCAVAGVNMHPSHLWFHSL